MIFECQPFWPEEPELWFVVLEALFDLHGIHDDTQKYNCVLCSLRYPSITAVRQTIVSPPILDKYEHIKTELISKFTTPSSVKPNRRSTPDAALHLQDSFLSASPGTAGSTTANTAPAAPSDGNESEPEPKSECDTEPEPKLERDTEPESPAVSDSSNGQSTALGRNRPEEHGAPVELPPSSDDPLPVAHLPAVQSAATAPDKAGPKEQAHGLPPRRRRHHRRLHPRRLSLRNQKCCRRLRCSCHQFFNRQRRRRQRHRHQHRRFSRLRRRHLRLPRRNQIKQHPWKPFQADHQPHRTKTPLHLHRYPRHRKWLACGYFLIRPPDDRFHLMRGGHFQIPVSNIVNHCGGSHAAATVERRRQDNEW